MYTMFTDRLSHYRVRSMSGSFTPSRFTILALAAWVGLLYRLAVITVLTLLEIEKDKIWVQGWLVGCSSQITLMSPQDVLLATRAHILSAYVFFYLPSSSFDSFVAYRAFPPILTLWRTTLLTFFGPFFMDRYLFVVLKAVIGPTYYMTVPTFYYVFGLQTVLSFTNGPRREKTCFRGFRQSESQTGLLSYWQVNIWYFQKSEQQRRWSDCADAQAGLRLCCSQTPKTGFLASRPK